MISANLNAQNVTSDRLYTQVDHMPQITNCYTSNGNMYKIDRCTSTALKSWFLSQMEYPPDALKAKIEEKFLFLAIVDSDCGKCPTKIWSTWLMRVWVSIAIITGEESPRMRRVKVGSKSAMVGLVGLVGGPHPEGAKARF